VVQPELKMVVKVAMVNRMFPVKVVQVEHHMEQEAVEQQELLLAVMDLVDLLE
jgi:hypothetical protein